MTSGGAVLIVGASGHGRSVLDIICHKYEKENIFFVDDTKKKDSTVYGMKVLGAIDDLPKIFSEYEIKGLIIAIGDNFNRTALTDKIKKLVPQIEFIYAVHPTAYIGREVQIGPGSVVMAAAVIGPGSTVGNHCIVNTKASVDHDCSIGDFSSIGPGAVLGGNVEIAECSAVGIGSTVIEKIKIGSNTIIGAGSTVLNNIDPGLLVYGTPAKKIRKRDKDEKYLA